MGNAQAGLNTEVRILIGSTIASNTDGDALQTATSVTLGPSNNVLDSTAFGDDAFQRIKGLEDIEVLIEGNMNYPEAAEGPQDILEKAFLNGTEVSVAVFPAGGSVGYEVNTYIMDYEISSDHDSTDVYSVSMMVSDGNKLTKIT